VKRSLVIITVLILLISLLPPYPRRATADDEYTYLNGTVTWDGDDDLDGWEITHDDMIECEFSPQTALESGDGHPSPSARDTGSRDGNIGDTVQFRCWVSDTDYDFKLQTNVSWDSWLSSGVTDKYGYIYGYDNYCTFDEAGDTNWGAGNCADDIIYEDLPYVVFGSPPLWQDVSINVTSEGYDNYWVKDTRFLMVAGNTTYQLMDNVSFSYQIRYTPDDDPPDDDNPGGFYYPIAQNELAPVSPFLDPMTWGAGTSIVGALYQSIDQGVAANLFIQPYVAQNYSFPDDAPDNAPFLSDMNDYTLIYQSDGIGVNVHSFGPGRVESVTSITAADCVDTISYSGGSTALAESLIAAGIGLITGGPVGAVAGAAETLLVDWAEYATAATPQICLFDIGNENLISDDRELFSAFPVGDIVEISDYINGFTYFYLVGDAAEFIEAGMMINDGCVIGRTMPLVIYNRGYFGQGITDYGYGAIWAEDTTLETPYDARYDYGQFPHNNESCNTPSFSECINLNPDFEKLKPALGWSDIEYGDIHLDGDTAAGLELDSSTSTSQILAVNGGTGLSVQLTGSVLTPNTDDSDSVINVDLGDTTHEFTLDAGGASFTEATTLASHSDSTYGDLAMRLTIEQDTGQDGTVLIERVCVSDVEFEPPPLPQCIFVNSGFDANSDWSLTGDAVIYGGALELDPTDTASQSISLAADVYDLEIKIRALPLTTPTGYSAAVDWDYTIETPEEVIASGTVGSTVSTWYVETDTFTVSSDVTDADFTLESDGSDTAQIDYICLIPQNQPVAPSDPDVVDVVDCQSCPATYTGNNPGDVVEAITWLDCRLRQVYQCDMRQILVDTRDATQETVRGIGMAGRWASASANINNKFLRSIAWYLGGHLNNVALMLSDTINYSGGAGITIIDSSGNFSFWDVIGLLFEGLRDVLMGLLDTINNLFTFLAPIVGTLADVILAAVDILQSVINAILGQVESVWYFVQALVDATATAPQTIEGMPDCTAGLASGDADWYCWGFYIIDNTIFAGPAQYFLPIVMAFAAFNLLVWGFRRVTNAMAAAG
jgi:hypothetical protein